VVSFSAGSIWGAIPADIELWIFGLHRVGIAHTGAAEDTGHLDELNGGLLAGVHLEEGEGVELEGWSGLVGKVREC
jgi:hypothetical protein